MHSKHSSSRQSLGSYQEQVLSTEALNSYETKTSYETDRASVLCPSLSDSPLSNPTKRRRKSKTDGQDQIESAPSEHSLSASDGHAASQIPLEDDSHMPCMTLRAIVTGLFVSSSAAVIQQLFLFKPSHSQVQPLFLQVRPCFFLFFSFPPFFLSWYLLRLSPSISDLQSLTITLVSMSAHRSWSRKRPWSHLVESWALLSRGFNRPIESFIWSSSSSTVSISRSSTSSTERERT